MNTLQNIRMMFPEFVRGELGFYSLMFVLFSLITLFAAGIIYGIRRAGALAKDELTDIQDSRLIAGVSIIQSICVLSLILTWAFEFIFVSDYPSVMTESKIGFALTTGAVGLMVLPFIFKKLDYALFDLGFVPIYFFKLLTGRIFKPGEMVVQTVQKHSRVPGPRAKSVRPEQNGDYIDYLVDKFRRVVSVGNEKVTVITRRGYLVTIKKNDPMLRRAGLMECLKYHDKFPERQMTERIIRCCPVNKAG